MKRPPIAAGPPQRRTFFVENGQGWRLALHRFTDPARLDRERRPVVIVPGYAMNSFIVGYHPRGHSLAGYLAHRGHEVWAVDLRAQGASQPLDHRAASRRGIGMTDLGGTDLGRAIDAVLERTGGARDGVDVIGCSLGATFCCIQLAWNPRHRIARMVNLGGPLRWTDPHPLLRAAARLPSSLIGRIGLRNTRALATRVLPALARVPGLLHIYLHPAICDLSDAGSLCLTVDDPIPGVNAEIVCWIRCGDLIDQGRNLSEDFGRVEVPLLTVIANADGICPEGTALSAHRLSGAAERRVIVAGSPDTPMAHADLFISDEAEAQVFVPLAEWFAIGRGG